MNEWTIPKKKDAVEAERDAALAREATLREALRIVQEEIIVRTPGLARLWLTVTEAALSTPAAPVLAEQEEKAAQLTRCLARSKTVHVADPAPCNCRVSCPAHDPGAKYAISPTLARQALEALQEMVDLMEDIRTGDYEPDTFTAQPARAAIAALEAALKEEP